MSNNFSTAVFIGIQFLLWLPNISFCQENPTKENLSNSSPAANYRIHQGDKLSVKFLYQPELSETSLIVRPDGFISLQLIDDIKVSGLTVSELKAQLEKEYIEILLKPVVNVSLLEFVAPRIYIGGQVNKPGRYDLRDGQTLIQVLFLSGGFTRDANKKMVLLARPDPQGGWQFQTADVTKILNIKKSGKDLMLQDGDYIYIPESKISKFNKVVEAVRVFLPRY